ncbi:MAG: hypothetical protein Q8N90_04390 [bacterium]|nr:hypothetical protein [bacterium]
MPNKIAPQIIERYNSLAKELKEVLFSGATSDIIGRICDFYHLSDEKADALTLLVGDVLMGFTHYNDFSKVLAEKMGGNIMVTQSISKEIDREIFLPIRKFLREVYRPISKEALLASEIKIEKEAETPSFIPESAPVVASIKLTPESIAFQESASSGKKVVQSEIVKRKSFLPFFKFKKSESAAPGFGVSAPVIIGKQDEIKPTLEASTPFVISFEEVSPQKEKVVSNMEVAMDKKSSEIKPVSQPVKIVNFSAAPAESVKPKEAFPTPKEQAPIIKQDASSPSETKKEAPPLIQFSPFSANKVNFPPSAVPNKLLTSLPPPAVPAEKPIQTVPKIPSAFSTPQEKPSASAQTVSEKMPEVPPENVVDLRKFKF